MWHEWFPGEEPGRKRVFVIGCGMYEALAVAAQEPLLDVVGIDSSAETVRLSSNLGKKLKNVSIWHYDVMNLGKSWNERFDLIVASGVMHHIQDDRKFARIVSSLLLPKGQAVIMVYGDCHREAIPRFCKVLKELGVPRTDEGIKFVRQLIDELPDWHPVKGFMSRAKDYDSQIVDLWLHPFFSQYSAEDLIYIMEEAGLSFNRWIDPALDFSWFEDLISGEMRAKFANMTFAKKSRIGQILNHADVKITGVFRKS